METDEQTIVEQEVGQAAETVTNHLRQLYDWFQSNFLTLESLYQLAAISATLFLALLLRRRVKHLLEKLSNERTLGAIVQRLMRTAAAIAMAVAWLLLVSIATKIFEQLSLPIEFLRLANSLLLAFVVIRIVSIFIPSHYWSQVFSWAAWSVAALNSVGMLDLVIAWLRETGISVGPVQITAWAVVKAIMLTIVLIWGANAFTAAIERRLQSAQKMSSALRLLITRLLRTVLLFLAVIIALAAVGVDLTVFAVFSGAVGIGVGIGAAPNG